MKRILSAVAIFATLQSTAQQVNPVPDYVFRNQMSVGRNAVTDTAAYFSIGPRYGANKGFMPPIVGDTATFSSGKRNGLLIFSVQKNKFLYWDSVRVQWSDMAGSSGSYIVAGDTAAMLSPYIRHAGYGLTKSGQSFLVDTLNISTRAWRQKGIDSVAGLSRIGGSGTAFYIPRFATSSTLQNSIIYDDGAKVGVGTSSPIGTFQVYKSGAPAYITLTGGSGANQGAAFVIYKSNNSLSLINIGDKAAVVGGAPDTAVTFRAGANVPLIFEPNAAEALRLNTNQTITATSLAGSGSRIVVADANGTLSASSALSGYVSGSGTTNYVPKFTAGSTIGNSQIVDNGTNVGIGTSSPNERLTIQSGTSIASAITFRANNVTSTSELFLGQAAGNEAYVYNRANQPMIFGTNNTERLRITSDGDILHRGTYNPLSAANRGNIMLNGSASNIIGFSNNSALRGYIFHTDSDFQFYNNTTGGRVGLYTEATARLWIQANGRIGINTTTDAGYQLDVNGTGRFQGTLYTRSGTAVGIEMANTSAIRNTGTQYFDYGTGGSGDFYFRGGSGFANVMTLTNGGNVGVGTASPAVKLDVTASGGDIAAFRRTDAGNALVQYTNANTTDDIIHRFRLNAGSGNFYDLRYYGTGGYFGLQYNGNNGLHLTTSSEVLINTTSDAGDYRLQVSGNIYNTGSITTGAPSGGSIKPWKIGEAATVSPTSPNRTIRVEIDGTVYYLHAKTTND